MPGDERDTPYCRDVCFPKLIYTIKTIPVLEKVWLV